VKKLPPPTASHGFGFGDALARLLRLPSESVYSKALTLFVGLSLLLGTAVVWLTSDIILGEFRQTESQEMVSTLQRFTIVLTRETRPVAISLGDWVERQPSGNISLPTPAGLAKMELDFASIAARDGTIEHSVFRTGEAGESVGKSIPWTDWLKAQPGMNAKDSGFILMGNLLTIIAWQPVPDGRIIVAGRFFGSEATLFLEGMFAARINFQPLHAIRFAGKADDPVISMLARNEFVVVPEDPQRIVGHVLVRSIGGQPIGQIRLEQSRPLYQEGEQAVQVFLTVLTLAGGALFVLIWFALDRTILQRILSLTHKVEEEKQFGRLPVKLEFHGIDELAHLAASIEDLAAELERAQFRYRAIVEDQTEVICRFSPGFAIEFSNGAFKKLFDQASEAGGLLKECLPPAAFELLSRKFQSLTPGRAVDIFLHQIARSEGESFWLRSTLRASFDPHGKPLSGQWVAADITPQVQAQQRLQASERELRSLSNRLLKLQDEERRRIARELHDSTAQSLSALEMNMSLMEPVIGDEKMRRLVAETRQIARDCCLELRTISYLLHPPLLEEVGLVFAIEWFADGLRKRAAIEIHLELMPDFPRLEPEVETTFFRVVQESLTNVHRHSNATKAWISLSLRDAAIYLEVRDNGSGFADDTSPTSGVGFASMRERLAQLGGTLEITSSPYGVSVIARLDHHPSHVRTPDQNPAS
jgi:PAS domain S-box-containing protein